MVSLINSWVHISVGFVCSQTGFGMYLWHSYQMTDETPWHQDDPKFPGLAEAIRYRAVEQERREEADDDQGS